MAADVQVLLAALVPPLIPRLPLLVPAALMLTRMFSMDAAVRAQPVQASRKRLQFVTELKRPAGKVVKDVQFFQVETKPEAIVGKSVALPVTELSKTSAGKSVRA